MIEFITTSAFLSTMLNSVHALDLKPVKKSALNWADGIRQYEYISASFQASAIAASQLSDPVLQLGALNLPVDTFKLSQEPITQIQAGISQVFPKGQTPKYQYLSLHEKSIRFH